MMVITHISTGQKLYLCRTVCRLSLWHPDPELALRLDQTQAQEMAKELRLMPTLAHGDVIWVE
jgi:hypothetical protein